MHLRKRLAIVALCFIVVFAVGSATTALAIRSWSHELDTRRTLLQASERVASLRASLLDQETGVRGYVLSGESTFLEPYERGTATAARTITDLRTMMQASSVDLSLLDSVQAAASAWRTRAAEPEISGRQHGTEATVLAPLTDLSKTMFDTLRGKVDDLSKAISLRLDSASNAAAHGRRLAIVSLSCALGVLVALTAVSAWLLQRWVVRPLAVITDATNKARLDDSGPIRAVGPPELRAVAAAIDQMQLTIRQQRDTAVNAREVFEQNAVLALRLSDELAHDVGEYPPGWEIAAGLRPAQGLVAGDCYDVSLLAPTMIGLVVLDIAGHGALAAVSAFRCKELLKVALRNGFAPGAALEWMAQQELGLDDSFFTAFAAAIDTDTGRCRFANAGHPPAVLIDAAGHETTLDPTGPLFGPVPPGWRTDEVIIESGSVLAVYTDGLVETRGADRTFYGEERVSTTLAAAVHNPTAMIDVVLDDASTFRAGRQADDVTLVVLCRDGVSPARDLEDAVSAG